MNGVLNMTNFNLSTETAETHRLEQEIKKAEKRIKTLDTIAGTTITILMIFTAVILPIIAR